jgi:hypothetical protein
VHKHPLAVLFLKEIDIDAGDGGMLGKREGVGNQEIANLEHAALAQVVINAVNLIVGEVLQQLRGELVGAAKVMAKGFLQHHLDLDAGHVGPGDAAARLGVRSQHVPASLHVVPALWERAPQVVVDAAG